MRIALAILTALGITFGAFALARGDEAADDTVTPKAFKALRAQVDALRAEVDYLRSRESALTTYVLMNEKRGKGLAAVVGQARNAGFEARSIPSDSRRILMDGLLAAARSIQQGLPKPTGAEAKMLKTADRLRKAAGLD